MVKIYTKTGDLGTTSLFGGQRVEKDSKRIDAYGNVDELNSTIGIILSSNPPSEIAQKLIRVQNELFILGSDLATPYNANVKIKRVGNGYISRLEKEIDEWDKKLPKLVNFILPGGSKLGGKLHLARTVARRAERSIVALANQEKINANGQIYINRLSDWLFVLARYTNHLENVKENIWKSRNF